MDKTKSLIELIKGLKESIPVFTRLVDELKEVLNEFVDLFKDFSKKIMPKMQNEEYEE